MVCAEGGDRSCALISFWTETKECYTGFVIAYMTFQASLIKIYMQMSSYVWSISLI